MIIKLTRLLGFPPGDPGGKYAAWLEKRSCLLLWFGCTCAPDFHVLKSELEVRTCKSHKGGALIHGISVLKKEAHGSPSYHMQA